VIFLKLDKLDIIYVLIYLANHQPANHLIKKYRDETPGAYVIKKISWKIITMEFFFLEIHFSWQFFFCVIKNCHGNFPPYGGKLPPNFNPRN
jgi:hypothetical protein